MRGAPVAVKKLWFAHHSSDDEQHFDRARFVLAYGCVRLRHTKWQWQFYRAAGSDEVVTLDAIACRSYLNYYIATTTRTTAERGCYHLRQPHVDDASMNWKSALNHLQATQTNLTTNTHIHTHSHTHINGKKRMHAARNSNSNPPAPSLSPSGRLPNLDDVPHSAPVPIQGSQSAPFSST